MVSTIYKEKLESYLSKISKDLDRTVNFWLTHSHDDDNGSFFTCLARDGKMFDNLKYGWLQGRQVWMYARLYNEVERYHTKDILDVAERGGDFIRKYLKNPSTGRCYFLLTKDGKPVKMQRTIFTECFYMMAMSELARATKKSVYKEEALAMVEKIRHWVLIENTELGRVPLEGAPPINSLAEPMMVLCLVDQMETMDSSLRSQLQDLTEWSVSQILAHVQRGGKVVLEHVSKDGKELNGSQGRVTIPGHVIEAGWFLLKVAQKRNDSDLKKVAMETFILKPFQSGWDGDYGGLFYYMDVDGWPPTQLEWSQKLWWPHNEAMIAFLMAYQETGKEVYLEKFEQIFDYCCSHFVDEQHGEWYGYLNRDGSVNMDFKGGPFKGCFHVPRCLMICEQLLAELVNK